MRDVEARDVETRDGVSLESGHLVAILNRALYPRDIPIPTGLLIQFRSTKPKQTSRADASTPRQPRPRYPRATMKATKQRRQTKETRSMIYS